MGSYYSSNSVVSCVPKLYGIGRPISTAIMLSILNDMKLSKKCGYDGPQEIALKCMEYVGFLMYSAILTSNEQCMFLDLLLPLKLFPKYSLNRVNGAMRYLDLLYRSSLHGTGTYTNKQLLSKILHKSKILIIYHTNFDHVFSIYLEQADFSLPLDYKKLAALNKQHIELFVLRSKLDKPERLKIINAVVFWQCFLAEDGDIQCISLLFQANSNRVNLDRRAFCDDEKAKQICGSWLKPQSPSTYEHFTIKCCEAYQLF